MTVGFFAPLPPARTGVADYAAALLAALRKHGRIEVNRRGRAEALLYHLGNNRLHGEVYERALREPGVTVLHDAVLHHFLLGCLNQHQYVEEFLHNYGEWTRGLAQTLWRERARSAADPRYFDYPMLRRAVESAKAVVVHNPAARSIAARHSSEARIVEIPHLFIPPQAPDPWAVSRLRRQMNLAPDAFLFAVFGHLRESKRIESVLAAFRQVREKHSRAALLIAGDVVSRDLAAGLEGALQGPGVRRVGYLTEEDFWLHAAATDACVNLRYPAAGETSGIAMRLMGIGKPVLVTDSEETSRVPEGACLRVDHGAAEVDMLASYMTWLMHDPDAALEIGKRAAAHIGQHHARERVAQLYWNVLEENR